MRHLDLFSGIGGFALATEQIWPEAEHIFCDNDPFSQAILKKHWPNSLIYGDIKELTEERIVADTKHNGSFTSKKLGDYSKKSKESEGVEIRSKSRLEGKGSIDLLTGGFPCQPFSQAGRRRGTEDSRHLWPEMLRVIRETNPTYVLGENVGGLLTWDRGLVFEQVCTDLESAGYEVGAFVIPAAAVGAPHRRDRIWIVAHATGSRLQGSRQEREGQRRLTDRDGSHERRSWGEDWTTVAAELCRVDDGVPKRLDRTPRLKALGNAIVPQVAAEIMRAMMFAES